VLLMAAVVAVLLLLGFVIGVALTGRPYGGLGLLGVFGVIAIVWSIIGYYAGAGMVLAVSGARKVTHDEAPQLWNVVEEMTIAAGAPCRRVRHRRRRSRTRSPPAATRNTPPWPSPPGCCEW
jgi:heat shock protein HtpX